MTRPLGILLISAGHERAHYALVLATGAAAVGREVVLFATNAGCRLFEAARPLESDPREALLAAAEDLGIRRLACEAGLRAESIQATALSRGVEVAGVVTFLAAVGEGQIVSL